MFRVNQMYIFPNLPGEEKAPYICSANLANGWVFHKMSLPEYIRYGNIGFVLEEADEIDEQFLGFKEHHREMPKTDLNKELFHVAMKIIKSPDVDWHLDGDAASKISNYEFEHNLFSEFWAVPRAEEKKWLEEPIDRRFRLNDEIYFEDEEDIDKALSKLRAIKQFVAEMKEA